ncbi:tRNA dimethylallyltransferase [Verrucomicrobia bacterium IMCC26134]|jgi:tRNA dimethylallyltransferase|nr:tRNA dimethylallyltransferase [Verrucomicrobia bacterium IMCC26134]
MCRNLYILTGPTAVGKTELALRWAERHGAEIVSCDASLFYRGMDIGTAKPTAAERARVPHHGIDVCAVSERMDVTRYVALAKEASEQIAARGRRVLVTGGSGFYLKAFFGAVADDVAVPAELRATLTARFEAADGGAGNGLAGLVAELRVRNPAGLGALDTANPRRVLRALERCIVSGKTLAELAAEFAAQPGPFADWAVSCTRLDREPEELRGRIAARVAAMLKEGLVAEVERLRSEGLKENPSAAAAIGYRETLTWLEAGRPGGEAALAAEIALNTWGLVRKQRTWFRTQLPAERVRVLAAGAATVESVFG